MSTVLSELVALLKAKIERGCRVDPIGSRERSDNLQEIQTHSLALIALCVADYCTIELEPAEWWSVIALRDGEAEWVEVSEHTDRECAERCAKDLVRCLYARDAKVVPFSPSTAKNGQAPPW